MTLVVHAGIYRPAVVRHLARLVPPEVWSIDRYGFVDLVGQVPESLARPAVRVLQTIVGAPGLVEVFGSEAAAEIVVDGANQKVGDVGGTVFIDTATLGPQARVSIIYDSSDNYGVGYWVRGADGTEIDCPVHIALGHELAHALDALAGTYKAETAEVSAIAVENSLRAADTPVLPARGTHEGGKKTAPKKSPTTTPPKRNSGCFIATAVLELGKAGGLDELRRFRDCRVRSTARGAAYMDAFYSCYGEVGARIAAEIAESAGERKALLSLVVAPVVSYLTLGVRCPEKPVDAADLPKAWGDFFRELQQGLECWAISAMPPRVDVPGDDIQFVARYVLRLDASRQSFDASLKAGEPSAALRHIVADAEERFARAVSDIKRPETLPESLQHAQNPLVLAAATLLRDTAVSELKSVRRAFDVAGLSHIFETAFVVPLVHFIRLAATLPQGPVPEQVSAPWREVTARLRDDLDQLSEAAMSSTMPNWLSDSTKAEDSAARGSRAHSMTLFGKDVGTLSESIRWRYTVTLRNADAENATYLNLRVYYLADPGGPEDMGIATLANLRPGEVGVFPLCECRRLLSYRIEANFIQPDGRTGDIVFPEDNGMTAKRAGDPYPCEDSWAF